MATRPNPQKRTTTQRGSARPQAGDATGREKARQMQEAAPALREAALSTTLINPPPVEETDEIVDATEVGGVREISAEELQAMIDSGDTEADLDDGELEDDVDPMSLPDGSTDVLLEDRHERVLDEPQPKHGNPLSKQFRSREAIEVDVPTTVEPQFKVMRVVEDLEDVTIGKDNHRTYREGVRYRVPLHVYEHLDEKGLVRH